MEGERVAKAISLESLGVYIPAYPITFSKDGSKLLFALDSCAVKVFDTHSGELIYTRLRRAFGHVLGPRAFVLSLFRATCQVPWGLPSRHLGVLLARRPGRLGVLLLHGGQDL